MLKFFIKKIIKVLKKIPEVQSALDNFNQFVDNNKIKENNNLIDKFVPSEIKWYDYTELDEANRRNYYLQAQDILKNRVFQNELNQMIYNFQDYCFKKAKNFDEVNNQRMKVAGLLILKERLESIPDPDNKPILSKKDIYKPI